MKYLKCLLIFSLLHSQAFAQTGSSVEGVIDKAKDYINDARGLYNEVTGGTQSPGQDNYQITRGDFLQKVGCSSNAPNLSDLQCDAGEGREGIHKTLGEIENALGDINPAGVAQCLKTKKETQHTSIQQMIDRINKGWDTVRDSYKDFEKNTAILKKSLKNNDDSLHKGFSPSDPIARLFQSPSCKSIDKSLLSKFMKAGLAEVNTEKYQEIIEAKEEFQTDTGLKARLQRFIKTSLRKAKVQGMDSFSKSTDSSLKGSLKNFSETDTFSSAMEDIKSEMLDSQEKTKSQLANILGTSSPDLIKSLSSPQADEDLDAVVRNWKNKSETDCFYKNFSGKDPQEQLTKAIQGGLRDKDSRGKSSTSRSKLVSTALINILTDQSISFRTKEKRIKDLISKTPRADQMYINDVSINNSKKSKTWSIPNFFKTLANNCLSAKNSSQSINNKSNLRSVIKKVNAIKKRVKKEKRSFIPYLKNQLVKRLITCEESTSSKEATPCQGEGTFKVTKNFCYNRAVSCSRSVDECIGGLKREVEKRKNNSKIAIEQLNQYSKSFIENQDVFFEGLKDSTLALSDQLYQLLGISKPQLGELKSEDQTKVFSNDYKELTEDLKVDLIDSSRKNLLDQFKSNKNILLAYLNELEEASSKKFEEERKEAIAYSQGLSKSIEAKRDACVTFKEKFNEQEEKCEEIVDQLEDPLTPEPLSLLEQVLEIAGDTDGLKKKASTKDLEKEYANLLKDYNNLKECARTGLSSNSSVKSSLSGLVDTVGGACSGLTIEKNDNDNDYKCDKDIKNCIETEAPKKIEELKIAIIDSAQLDFAQNQHCLNLDDENRALTKGQKVEGSDIIESTKTTDT